MKFYTAAKIIAFSTSMPSIMGVYTNSIKVRHQPIYHTPGVGSVGYTGDPNGMFYHEPTDTYHLFWQCSIDPGHASPNVVEWCHAISKDFAKWERLLAQDEMNYSGGATQTKSGNIKMLYKDTGKGNAFYTASPADLTDPKLEMWLEDVNASAIGGATDPSPGWPSANDDGFFAVVGSNVGTNGSATLWSSDSEFDNFVNLDKMLLTFPWDRSGPNDSPIPRDPNFFQPHNSDLWAFEGAMKMCFYTGHDFYALGNYDEVNMEFSYDDELRQLANDPYDFGGDMYAAETFYSKDGSVIMSSWVLEGDCDWNVNEWPPVEHCPEALSRGWLGVHSLPRKTTVETTSPLPGSTKERNSLKFEPVEGLKNLRLTSEPVTVTAEGQSDGSVTYFDSFASKSYEAEMTFDWPGVDSFDVGFEVLSNADHTEFTRLGIRDAIMMENTELTYNLQSQFASAECAPSTTVADAAACKTTCDGLDDCLGWTMIPAEDDTNTCHTLCGVVPLATSTAAGCDWGNNLGHDPALSTSGMKGKWGLAYVQRGASSNLDGAYGKHDFVGLVRFEDDEDAINMRVFVDVSIVEIFAQGGRSVVTARVYPQDSGSVTAGVYGKVVGGSVDLKADAWEMGPAFDP